MLEIVDSILEICVHIDDHLRSRNDEITPNPVSFSEKVVDMFLSVTLYMMPSLYKYAPAPICYYKF